MFKKMLALMALGLIAANVEARHSTRAATVADNCDSSHAPECYYTREFTKPAICDKQVSCVWSCPADCQAR